MKRVQERIEKILKQTDKTLELMKKEFEENQG